MFLSSHQPPATSHFLAAGLVTPAFLVAGLLLTTIPLAIHFLNRRRFKTVQWAAMNFLLAALKRNRRRMKFEQWILLATRCAIVSLLGFALARPVGCERAGLAAGGMPSALHVIIIDNSGSMAYRAERPQAVTQFDQAKLLAKKLIGQLESGGESVSIITAARPARVVLQPTYDLAAAALALDRVEQTFAATDFPHALQEAIQVGQENARQPARRLEIISDGTRSAWEVPAKDAFAASGKEIARLFQVRHFNIAQADQWNASISDLRAGVPLVRVGFNAGLQATPRSYGKTARGLMSWSMDRQSLPGAAAIDVGVETPAQTQSDAHFREGGKHVATATLSTNDRLSADDTRSAVIDVAAALKVLIVEGERGAGALAGSGAFINLALAPSVDTPDPASPRRAASYVQPELASDIELANKVLTDYRAVILCGVGDLSAGEAETIKRYVEEGGTLLIFAGEAVSAESYNRVLLPRGLLPAPLTKRVSVSADQRGFLFDFKPRGALHPLLQIFANEENTGLDTAQVFTYWQIDLPADAKAQRVLDYVARDAAVAADPAITLHALGAGRVVFVTTTANAEWTSLPAKPAFVALIHELLSGSLASGDAWMNLSAGEVLRLPPTVTFRAAPKLLSPANREIQLQPSSIDGRPTYVSPPLDVPGVYLLNTGEASLPVAVNFPAEESDVRPVGDAAIAAALGGIAIETAGDSLPDLTAAHAVNDFGWLVMVLLLVLVGGESWLAMRFGHQRRDAGESGMK